MPDQTLLDRIQGLSSPASFVASPEEAEFASGESPPDLLGRIKSHDAFLQTQAQAAQIHRESVAQQGQQWAAQHPILNAGQAALAGVGNFLTKGVAQIANLDPDSQSLTPKQMTNVYNQAPQAVGIPQAADPDSTSGRRGALVGQIAPILASGPGAPLVMMAQGLSGRQEEIDRAQAGGAQLTPQQIRQYQVAGTGIDAALSLLLPGSRFGGAVLERAGVNTLANPFARAALRTLIGGATVAPEMAGYQAAQNFAAQQTIDPTRPIGRDVPEAAKTGLALGGVGSLIHPAPDNALARAREAQAAQPAPAEPFAPKTDAEMDQLVARAAAKQAEPKPAPSPAPEQPAPAPSAREQEMVRLQQWATEHGEKAPELTPGLHTEPTEGEQANKPTILQQKAGDQAVREEYGEQPEAQVPSQEEAQVTPVRNTEVPLASTEAEKAPTTEGANALAGEEKLPPITPPEKETFFQRIAREGAEKLKQATTEEHGGADPEYFKVPVKEAAQAAVKGLHSVADTFRAVDRQENWGFTDSDRAKTEEQRLTSAIADANINGRKFEAQVAPYIQHVPTFKDDRAGALHWADQVEASGNATDIASQPAVDALMAMRNENFQRARKLGIPLQEVNALQGMALSRQFKPGPDYQGRKSGTGKGTVQGDTSTLISQKHETASAAYNAAGRLGLIPEDPDPLTWQIRSQYEMARILQLREQLHASEDTGNIAWGPDDAARPEGHGDITDRIAEQTRRQANPDWVVAKYAKGHAKEGGFDKEKWLDENEKNMIHIRPGDDLPKGYSYNGRDTKGTYYAPDDVANKWNTATRQTLGGDIGQLAGKAARIANGIRYSYNIAHALTAPVQMAYSAIGEALKNIPGVGKALGLGTNKVPLLDLARDMNIYGPRTNEVLKEIQNPGSQSPEIQDIARSLQRSGADIKVKSVLDPKPFQNASDALHRKNIPAAVGHFIAGLGKTISDWTFKSVLNRAAVAKGRELIESQRRAGVGEAAGAQDLRSQTKVLTDAFGRHLDTPLFKNSMADAIGSAVFPAFKYRTGLLKNIARGIAGNEHAKTLMAGTIVGTALASAATQMALTLINTGKVIPPTQFQDYWNPRTGKKDDQGHEERVAFGPGSFMARIIGLGGGKKMLDELKGMAPIVTHAYETAANKDYAGNQVRPTGGNPVANFARGVGHTLSGGLPITATTQLQSSNPQGEEIGWGQRLAKYAGVSLSHPVTSEAENILYDSIPDSAGRTPDQQSKHDKEAQWTHQIRAGDAIGAIRAMQQDTSIGRTEIKNLVKRARSQPGLAGLVRHPGVTPDALLHAWQAGSEEDRTTMRFPILQRMAHAKPANLDEAQKWKALRNAVH